MATCPAVVQALYQVTHPQVFSACFLHGPGGGVGGSHPCGRRGVPQPDGKMGGEFWEGQGPPGALREAVLGPASDPTGGWVPRAQTSYQDNVSCSSNALADLPFCFFWVLWHCSFCKIPLVLKKGISAHTAAKEPCGARARMPPLPNRHAQWLHTRALDTPSHRP